MASITVELSEFDNGDIIDRAIEIAESDEDYKDQLRLELFPDYEENADKTIRDEQYEEIFEQLKEKYSVQDLQRLLA